MMAVQFIVVLVCMLCGAFFAGMETGIISIHRMRLEHRIRQGERGAARLRGYLLAPDRLLGTTLVGTNICVVVVSVVSASIAVELLGDWGETVSTAVMSLLILVFCEYLPKVWFHSRPLERTRRFTSLLRFSELMFLPLSKITIWLTRWLVPGPSSSFSTPAPFVTKEDLKLLAREGEEGGELSYRERVMINRVFELSHRRVRQVMIPRAGMTIVNSDTTLADFFDTARESELTRIPVYDRETDTFIGVMNVFYVLSVEESLHSRPVSEFARPPLFISEDMPVDDVLPRLRRSRQPMCLVTDVNDRVTGLLTTEDILEEIVGKL